MKIQKREEPSPLRYELLLLLWLEVAVVVCLCAVVVVVGGVEVVSLLWALFLWGLGPSIFISLPAIDSENRLGGSSLE